MPAINCPQRTVRSLAGLLDVTKIQSGQLDLYKTSFILDDLIQESIEEIALLSPKHSFNFKSGQSIQVWADRERISQVLMNLFSNAIKYSLPSTSINIEVNSEPGKTIVSVADRGIGVDSKEQQKIFDNFYRVKGSYEQTFPGFGTGLYIASEIIKQHQGAIWVESSKNNGATFYFSLPAENTHIEK